MSCAILDESPFIITDAKHKCVYSYRQLERWSREGLRAGDDKKGPIVKLETVRMTTGKATSLAAIRRFLLALNDSSEKCDRARIENYVPSRQ